MGRAFRSGMQSRYFSASRREIVAALDIGSEKIMCLVARLTPCEALDIFPERTHAVEILGWGYQRAYGVKSGVIVDIHAVERSIRLAVDHAERSAALRIESVLVGVGCAQLRSTLFPVKIDLNGRKVCKNDIQKAVLREQSALEGDRVALHTLPVSYRLDDVCRVSNPIGMKGKTLGINVNVVSAEFLPLCHLETVVNNADLDVASMVALPYASGLSTLLGDESHLGAICIDIGGGTTSVSVFENNALVYVDSIALGGRHVTQDVAAAFSIDLQEAERVKIRHGSALPMLETYHKREIASCQPGGGGRTQQVHALDQAPPDLRVVISRRLEEIFEILKLRLNQRGFCGGVGRRIILTGGVSQTVGLPEMVQRLMGAHVRLGRPIGVSGLPEPVKGPSGASATGLLIYPQITQFCKEGWMRSDHMPEIKGGYVSGVARWLKESFWSACLS